MSNEPIAIGTAVEGLLTAALVVANQLGAHISPGLQDSLLGLLAALIVVIGLVMRMQVIPIGRAKAKVDAAFNANPVTGTKPTI